MAIVRREEFMSNLQNWHQGLYSWVKHSCLDRPTLFYGFEEEQALFAWAAVIFNLSEEEYYAADNPNIVADAHEIFLALAHRIYFPAQGVSPYSPSLDTFAELTHYNAALLDLYFAMIGAPTFLFDLWPLIQKTFGAAWVWANTFSHVKCEVRKCQ